MPLPVVGQILRKIQDSIYPSRPSAEETNETAAFESADDGTHGTDTHIERNLESSFLDTTNFNLSGQANQHLLSSSLSEERPAHSSTLQASSPSEETYFSRE